MTQQNQAREEMPQNSRQSSLYSSTDSLDVLNNYFNNSLGIFQKTDSSVHGELDVLSPQQQA